MPSSSEKDAVNVSFRIPHKTLQLINRYAEEYNMSRANMLLRLVELGLVSTSEKLERTTTLPEGTKTWANYPMRKIL